MTGKQILFFSTASDIRPIMSFIESSFSIKYYSTGLFDTPPSHSINSIEEIQDFGKAGAGDWNRDLKLMMVPNGNELVIRDVPQRKGGIKYAVDPLANQVSICFQFGGVFEEGVLVAGSCGTAFLNDFSLEVFNTFASKLKQEFKKIGEFYVGKDAEERLKQGWRLVTNVKMSKEQDLIL